MSCIILYIAWSAFYNTCRQHVFLVLYYIYMLYIYAMTRNRRHVQCVYIVEYTIHTLDLYISVYICICYIIQYIWYSPAGIALWRRCMVVILYSCRYIGVCNMYNMYIIYIYWYIISYVYEDYNIYIIYTIYVYIHVYIIYIYTYTNVDIMPLSLYIY